MDFKDAVIYGVYLRSVAIKLLLDQVVFTDEWMPIAPPAYINSLRAYIKRVNDYLTGNQVVIEMIDGRQRGGEGGMDIFQRPFDQSSARLLTEGRDLQGIISSIDKQVCELARVAFLVRSYNCDLFSVNFKNLIETFFKPTNKAVMSAIAAGRYGNPFPSVVERCLAHLASDVSPYTFKDAHIGRNATALRKSVERAVEGVGLISVATACMGPSIDVLISGKKRKDFQEDLEALKDLRRVAKTDLDVVKRSHQSFESLSKVYEASITTGHAVLQCNAEMGFIDKELPSW